MSKKGSKKECGEHTGFKHVCSLSPFYLLFMALDLDNSI